MDKETIQALPDGFYIVTQKDELGEQPKIVKLYTKTDSQGCAQIALDAAEKKLDEASNANDLECAANDFASALRSMLPLAVVPVRGFGYGEWDGGAFIPLEDMECYAIFPVVLDVKRFDQHGRLI